MRPGWKLVGVLYSATAIPVLYLRWQSRAKRKDNAAFIEAHGLTAPESERMQAVSHLLSGDATRLSSNEHFEGSNNCNLVRKQTIQFAKGDVLEVGIGTGEKVIPAYMRNTLVKSLTGIDAHALALEVCAKNMEERKFNRPVTLVLGRAEELPFPDNAFDTVISEFSLCAIENPEKALREMARVAKHRILIVEHGLSYWRIIRWLGYWSSLFPDPQHPWSYGCYQDRDILEIIKKSGLKIVKLQTSSLGHVYSITLAPGDIADGAVKAHEPIIVYKCSEIS